MTTTGLESSGEKNQGGIKLRERELKDTFPCASVASFETVRSVVEIRQQIRRATKPSVPTSISCDPSRIPTTLNVDKEVSTLT